ncbi:kinase-like protein [Hypoxylon crocopeplum]|nr:kinase-like protein [Hypoxylon crocopeplum]
MEMATQLAEEHAEKLKKCFSDDKRFQFKNLIAHGAYGSACRVQYIDPAMPSLKDFLIKSSFNGKGAREAMLREKKNLERLRGNPHIVQLVDIPNNPLQQPDSAFRWNQDDWIIMEWLGCGTFGEFIMSARHMKHKRMPNRLLWRTMLCLIRACVAMAWPDQGEVVGSDELTSRLVHNDLHLHNVLLGEPPMDEEHTFAPILKLIDFGLAREWRSWPGLYTATQKNIYDVGRLMTSIIGVTGRHKIPQPPPQVTIGSDPIETDAAAILPFDELLDPEIGEIACACMATDPEERPTLQNLEEVISAAVRERTAAYYDDREDEQDAYIEDLWRQITYTGPHYRES